ncbi:MAG: glycosyltransferase family A protein, partial [Bacteroidota bacterium]
INDGSTDHSLSIVESFTDERLRIFSIENKGVSHARNYGVDKCKAEYIAFLDADDQWKPHHLTDLKNLIELFPECGMYAKAYSRLYKSLNIESTYATIPKNTPWRGILDNYFEASMANSIALTSAVLVTKQAHNKINGFNTKYNSGEDTDYWIRIALTYPVAFDNTISVIHYLDSDNKLTYEKLSKKSHATFNDYTEQEQNRQSLKAYLDLNRYAVGMQYKIEGDQKQAAHYLKAIDFKNLSIQKRWSTKLPGFVLKTMLKLRNGLRKLGMNLPLFR